MTRRMMFLALAVWLAATAGVGWALAARWSDTQPRINETHVFHGEINRRGRPVGFHSRPVGATPTGRGWPT